MSESNTKKRRWLRWLVLSLASLVLTVAFFINTNIGLNLSLSIIGHYLPGELKVTHARGHLHNHVTIKQLVYSDPQQQITIDNLDLHWNLFSLFLAKLHIRDLDINTITVAQTNTGNSSSSSGDTSVPMLMLDLDHIAVQHIVLQQGDSSTQFSDLQLAARARLSSVDIDQLAVTGFGYRADLQGQLTPSGRLPFQGNLSVHATEPGSSEIQAQIRGDLDHAELNINSSKPVQSTVKATATFDWPHVTLQGDWTDIDWRIASGKHLRSASGNFNLSGTPLKYTFRTNSQWRYNQTPIHKWQLTGSGNLFGLNFESSLKPIADTPITVSGQVDWRSGLAWQVDLTTKKLNLNPYFNWPQWSSAIDLSVHSSGQSTRQGLQYQVQLQNIKGHWGKQSIAGNFDLKHQQGQTTLAPSQLTVGNASLSGSAQLDTDWQANWAINVPNLSKLIPTASGRISSQGRLLAKRAQLKQLILNDNTQISNLRMFDWSISQLNTQVNWQADTQYLLNINAAGLSRGGHTLDKLDINSTGNFNNHHVTLDLSSHDRTLNMSWDGSWQDQYWQGVIRSLNMTLDLRQHWQLDKPVQLRIGDQEQKLDPLCISSGDQRMCINATRNADHSWSAQASAKAVDLSNFISLLPNITDLQGILNLDGTVQADSHQTATANINMTAKDGYVIYPINQTYQCFDFTNAQSHITMNQQGLNADTTVQLKDQAPAEFNLQLPRYHQLGPPSAEQTISAKLKVQLNNLSFIPLISPKVSSATGQLQLNYEISGTLGSPILSGSGKLSDGNFVLPLLGIELKQVNGSLTGGNNGNFHYQANAKSGDGELHLNGQSRFRESQPNSRIKITGSNFLASNTPELKAVVTPNLEFRLNNDTLYLTGDLDVPQANIKPRDFSDTTQLPRDVVIIKNDQPVVQASNVNRLSKLKLNLGDDVRINFGGLDARLTGTVDLTEAPRKLTTASGELRIEDGKYHVYGQTLDIQHGQLVYSNTPVDNPSLNIRAGRRVLAAPNNTNITSNSMTSSNIGDTSSATQPLNIAPGTDNNNMFVGVEVQGQLRNPRISLFSEPATLSQADILSYMLTGRPLAQVSMNDKMTLLQAASALGGGSGQGQLSELTQQLQQATGLDNISFGSESDIDEQTGEIVQHSSLILGKYLSPRLYMSYSVGLMNPARSLRLHYQLTDRLAIQSEANPTDRGVDLLYTFERD